MLVNKLKNFIVWVFVANLNTNNFFLIRRVKIFLLLNIRGVEKFLCQQVFNF